MKLFLDEDMGTGIPKALKLVKMPCDSLVYPHASPPIRFGTSDTQWLEWVGDNGYLAISADRHILETPGEFDILVAHDVGIVFLDSGGYRSWQVLKWMINRWAWLDAIDRTETRPFAYITDLSGSSKLYDLSRGPRRPRPYRSPPPVPDRTDED